MSPLGRNVSVHSPLSRYARRCAASLLVSGSRPKGGAAVAVSSHLCGPIINSLGLQLGPWKEKEKKKKDFFGRLAALPTRTVVQPPLFFFWLPLTPPPPTAITVPFFSSLPTPPLRHTNSPGSAQHRHQGLRNHNHIKSSSQLWTCRRSPCIVSIVRLGSFDSFFSLVSAASPPDGDPTCPGCIDANTDASLPPASIRDRSPATPLDTTYSHHNGLEAHQQGAQGPRHVNLPLFRSLALVPLCPRWMPSSGTVVVFEAQVVV